VADAVERVHLTVAKPKRTQEDHWQPVFYETARGERPAWDFLTGKKTPIDVRIELLTTVRAVLQVGPTRFPTATQRWRLMHKPANKKEVDLSGICEARDKHSNKLYRLFCVIDRDAPAHGLALPSLVLLGGFVKPARTEAPQSEYRRIDRYRGDYQATHRVALGRDGAGWWPDVGTDMS
jgi:hypothetical protein